MAGLIDFSLRDLRDKFLADLAKTECELREHLVNTMAVAQVRSSASAGASAGASSNNEADASLQSRIKELEDAATAASIAHQAELKKLRKENVELQGRIKENKQVDELEAQLEEANCYIRGLKQEKILLENIIAMNDKYAQQDKKTYEDILAQFKTLETSYNELKKSAVKAEAKVEAKEQAKPEAAKPEEPKKEVKKVVKPEPEPEEEEQEEETAEEEEAEEAEEEGEEPVEFEYKGKTYYLSSDNDVYEEQEGEFVQVGTWNGKKIIFV